MQPVNDLGAIVHGAEQAAARGDSVSAERLLRQALALQEATLGPKHPEVANTLNNLAIVCEMNAKLSDAESCYRRSYAIAVSSLPPTDPFVTMSRENLEEFCTAHGLPLKRPAAPVIASPATAVPAASSAPPPRLAPEPKVPAPRTAAPSPKAAATPPPRAAAPPSLDDFPIDASVAAPSTPRTSIAPVAVREPSRAPAITAMLAILVAVLAAGWYLLDSTPVPERASTPPASSNAAPPSAPSPATTEPVRQPAPVFTETAATTPPPAPELTAPLPAPEPKAPAAAAPESPTLKTGTSSVDVVTAELCRSLTTSGVWNCAPATGTLSPGPFVFYTRVASPRDTTIEHRWYRDDRLHQSVPLRIRANPSGFRTYSRTTVTPDRVGKWKVELRTVDGALLDEKTFAVQP